MLRRKPHRYSSSRDRRKTWPCEAASSFAQALGWGLPAERLAWASVEFGGDCGEAEGVWAAISEPWFQVRERVECEGRLLHGLLQSVAHVLGGANHLACEGRGRPLAFVVTSGNTNDCTQFTTVMEAIRVPRAGPGRPRVRPGHVRGDKGYSSKGIHAWLCRRAIPHTIPSDPTRSVTGLGAEAARRPSTERSIIATTLRSGASTLKHRCGIATRNKTVHSYDAAVTLASLLIWA
ncbi:transposase [Streptomyces pratensis]|uniref:transposase n=1 Tax=Streptomyces pratensis TaxID=1169025 RepID=UPI0037B02F24